MCAVIAVLCVPLGSWRSSFVGIIGFGFLCYIFGCPTQEVYRVIGAKR
ncbi:hypothetical protein FEAC_29200 [Ferrimicrobium acidiphilum DSM 19497]|uniref:Uncharacterized protein n=1 Tax=Ferrimicrobium acidiphilum DSM 19497 TaxID=1121877 RepID=A0A0D8FPZ9_9ACTN|nr:hypothetical protein FEAC_29200 [Ferrimicrobium acidiphilum DSM 19497]